MREYMLNDLRFQFSDEDAKRLGAVEVEDIEAADVPVDEIEAVEAPVEEPADDVDKKQADAPANKARKAAEK